MPYIITTHAPDLSNPAHRHSGIKAVTTRTAVATLKEARTSAFSILIGINHRDETGAQYIDEDTFDAARALPDAGGTVGPLPDGTVIEVRPVSTEDLARMADIEPHAFDPDRPAPIIAAFNAQA